LGAIKHPVFCRPVGLPMGKPSLACDIGCVAGFVQCMAGPSPSTHKPSHREPSAAIQSHGVGLPRRCAPRRNITRLLYSQGAPLTYRHGLYIQYKISICSLCALSFTLLAITEKVFLVCEMPLFVPVNFIEKDS
jgi:hypothetical protein